MKSCAKKELFLILLLSWFTPIYSTSGCRLPRQTSLAHSLLRCTPSRERILPVRHNWAIVHSFSQKAGTPTPPLSCWLCWRLKNKRRRRRHKFSSIIEPFLKKKERKEAGDVTLNRNMMNATPFRDSQEFCLRPCSGAGFRLTSCPLSPDAQSILKKYAKNNKRMWKHRNWSKNSEASYSNSLTKLPLFGSVILILVSVIIECWYSNSSIKQLYTFSNVNTGYLLHHTVLLYPARAKYDAGKNTWDYMLNALQRSRPSVGWVLIWTSVYF